MNGEFNGWKDLMDGGSQMGDLMAGYMGGWMRELFMDAWNG